MPNQRPLMEVLVDIAFETLFLAREQAVRERDIASRATIESLQADLAAAKVQLTDDGLLGHDHAVTGPDSGERHSHETSGPRA